MPCLTAEVRDYLWWAAKARSLAPGETCTVGKKPHTKSECYAEALRQNPKSPKLWNNLAATMDPEDHIEVSGTQYTRIACYIEALKCDENYANAWNNLGFVIDFDEDVQLDKQRSFTKIGCFVQALHCDDNHPEAWNNLANAMGPTESDSLKVRGSNRSQIDCYVEALRCNNSYADAWNNLGSAISSGDVKVQDTKYTKRDCYIKAIKHNSGLADAWNNLAVTMDTDEIIEVNDTPHTKVECFAAALRCDRSLELAWEGLALTMSSEQRVVVNGESLSRGDCEHQEWKHRTFAKSQYRAHYRIPSKRAAQLEHLFTAVQRVVERFTHARNIPQEEVEQFLRSLRETAFASSIHFGRDAHSDPSLKPISIALWTATAPLNGFEFCSMLNEAIRKDASPLIKDVITVSRAMNSFLVTRNDPTVEFRELKKVYRGGAMPRVHHGFFNPGVKYRAPMYIATSREERVATGFMNRVAPASEEQQPPWQEPVMWVFHFDKRQLPLRERCSHVNYIDGCVSGGEEEFLFVPYAVFTVRDVRWVTGPQADLYETRPNRIEVDVAPDNTRESEHLPLAPWC